MQLYLDMDGVLMDFDKHLLDNGLFVWGNQPGNRTYYHLPKEQWMPHEAAHDSDIQALMATDQFWRDMPPTPDAHVLWGWCAGLGHHVLTATPSNATYKLRCARDKLSSIHRWFDPTFPAERFNAVLRSEKQQYADGNVLVDDNEGNCREWTAAGGTAILHKDAISTIKILRELFHA